MKTYLVTGAAGFIGAKLASALLEKGHRVVTVDNLSTGERDVIPEGTIFLKGDCQDQQLIDRLYEYEFAAVFHIAGQSSGEISFDNPVYDLQTNAQSTLQLLKMCKETGCGKFIYASTMSVYGDQEQLPVGEDCTTQPKSFYGVGKLASEHYLRIYADETVGTAALRLFNVYGPGQNLENMRQGMVSIFLAQALKDQHIHVKGSAQRFRDFVYIDDVVEAFLLTEEKLAPADQLLFNVCSGTKTTVGQLVDTIIEQVGGNITTRFAGSTAGDQFGIFGDNSRIQALLGWLPQVSMNEGMKRMVDWAKKELA